MSAHELVAQRAVAHGLLALLGRGVEDHAGSEDRLHERIGGGLVELLVGRAEERLLRRGSVEHHEPVTREVDLADLAALVVHALQQAQRVAAQLEQMAEQRQATRCDGRCAGGSGAEGLVERGGGDHETSGRLIMPS